MVLKDHSFGGERQNIMNTKNPDVALDRTVLPIPEPDYPHSEVLDAHDAAALRNQSARRSAQRAG
jgi:hypothetical protein